MNSMLSVPNFVLDPSLECVLTVQNLHLVVCRLVFKQDRIVVKHKQKRGSHETSSSRNSRILTPNSWTRDDLPS